MKVLPGCGHSFHLTCFPCGKGIWSICKVELTNAVKTLSASASQSIRHPEQNTVSEDPYQDESDEEFEDLEAVPDSLERDEITIAEMTMKLQQEIASWGMIARP